MALSANRELIRIASGPAPTMLQFPVTASTRIYKGAIVALNTGSTYALQPASTTNKRVIGFAAEEADNSAGALGSFVWTSMPRQFQPRKQNLCTVWTSGLWVHPFTGAAETHIGTAFWTTADDTIAAASTGDTDRWLGYGVGVYDTNQIVIQLKPGLGDLMAS